MTQIPAQKTSNIVLASSSRYRKDQLQSRLGLNLQTRVPDIDETPEPDEAPSATAFRLSRAKALAVSPLCSSGDIVIAGDQTASFNGKLLHKPREHQEAVRQLTAFSGNTVQFYSGVCVMEAVSGRERTEVVETYVKFRHLSAQQIEHYLRLDEPYDCVGAFKNEARGIALFEMIESLDPSALTGLPLIKTTALLAEFGVDVLAL